MCGIVGWIGREGVPADRSAVRRMAAALAHRGPDDAGEHFDDAAGFGLGFRRLAILDLTPASAQPMVDRESGLVFVYNGELYNFVELRDELARLGHDFATRGDVEVVLKALVEWRECAFERFAGMFAIAAWDPRERTLWLARDALGMKPLYVAPLPEGGVAFASEIRALFGLPGVRRRLDPSGLAEYLEFGYRIEESATMLAGLSRLAPAEVLALRDGNIVRRFRHFVAPLPDRGDVRSGDERASELLSTLRTVVAQHLVADVPVGLLLSGGLDSSLIAALAERERLRADDGEHGFRRIGPRRAGLGATGGGGARFASTSTSRSRPTK